MTRFQKAILFALIFTSISSKVGAQVNTEYDYCFLVDCSGSMIGLPKGSGSIVIFPEVAKDIKSFIDSIKEGANVSIILFHRGLQGELVRSNVGHSEKEYLKSYIDSVQDAINTNPGQVTWIYLSLRDVLDKLKATDIESERRGVQRIQTILLYTDGRDNGPTEIDGKRINMESIIEKFKLQRADKENLYLKYITLGVDLPKQEEDLLRATKGVELIKQRGPVFENKAYNVELRPIELNFGNFRQVDNAQCEVEMTLNKEIYEKYPSTKIKLSYTIPDNLPAGSSISISPQELSFERNVIPINLRILKTGGEISGSYEGEIQFGVAPFRDENGKKDVTIYFTPERMKYKFVVTAPLRIDVSTPDKGPLNKDFGELAFRDKPTIELGKEYIFSYNDAAQAIRLPLGLCISLYKGTKEVKYDPEQLYLSVDGRKITNYYEITKSSKVGLALRIRTEMPAGEYLGKLQIKIENASMTGEGLETIKAGPYACFIPFKFSIKRRPPKWALPAAVGGGGLALIALCLALYCRKRKKYPEGSYLSIFGNDIYLEDKSCLKSIFDKTISVGGTNSQVEVPGLPSEVQFYIKPVDEDSISISPAGLSVLRDFNSAEIPNGEEVIIVNGGHFQIEVSPAKFEKITFKKSF